MPPDRGSMPMGVSMYTALSLARPSVARRYTAALLVLTSALGGCFQSYIAKPLPSEDAATAFAQRSLEDPGLRAFMTAHGVAEAPWPPTQWRLRELTLLALYYRHDVALAQAQAQVSRAGVVTAGQRPNPGLISWVEHHSRPPAGERPWTLGLEIDIPIITAGKREARIEQAEALAAAADLDVAAAVWIVRSRVRLRLMEYLAVRRELALVEAESEVRTSALRLLEQRLAFGAASAVDVANERLRLLAVQGAAAAIAHPESERHDRRSPTHSVFPLQRCDHVSIIDAELDRLVPIDDTDGVPQGSAAESSGYPTQPAHVRGDRGRAQTGGGEAVSRLFRRSGSSSGTRAISSGSSPPSCCCRS